MCDRVILFESALKNEELEIDKLTTLLKRCQEKKMKRCFLIQEQLDKRKVDVDLLKNMIISKTKLCELYRMLEEKP